MRRCIAPYGICSTGAWCETHGRCMFEKRYRVKTWRKPNEDGVQRDLSDFLFPLIRKTCDLIVRHKL